jgi:hypothetical protein
MISQSWDAESQIPCKTATVMPADAHSEALFSGLHLLFVWIIGQMKAG